MPDNIISLIGARIAEIRKRRDFTQQLLAESIQVRVETISRLERGVTTPSLETLERISRVLNTSLKDFFDFDRLQKPVETGELSKMINFLKTKREDDLKLSYRILKDIFRQIEKNYRLKV
jgi:transcriptional regulator with XRE-family HTH domain